MGAKEWVDLVSSQGLAIALVVAGVVFIARHLPTILQQHREGMAEIATTVKAVGDKVDGLPDRIADRVRCQAPRAKP